MPLSRDIFQSPVLSITLALSLYLPLAVQAQGNAPDNQVKRTSVSAPIPGGQLPVESNTNASMSKSGNWPVKSEYYKLPISVSGATLRLEELRNLMLTLPARDFQEKLNDYLDWLSDMADSHWRLSIAFAKNESTKPKADVEKDSALKFGRLKRQGQLLKAEFLVKQNRTPEALAPLVEIVQVEPNSATGESAYALLKQIGFAEESQINSVKTLNKTEAAAPVVKVAPKTPVVNGTAINAPDTTKSNATKPSTVKQTISPKAKVHVPTTTANRKIVSKLTGKGKR